MAAWVINQIKTKRNNNILKFKKTLNGCSLYVYRFLHDHVTRCMNNRSCFAFLQIHKTQILSLDWRFFLSSNFFNSASLFINLLVRHFLFAYEWENGDRNRCTVRLYAKHARSLSGLPYGMTDSYSTHTRKHTPNVQQSDPTYGCLSSNSLKKFKRYICIFYWQLIIS